MPVIQPHVELVNQMLAAVGITVEQIQIIQQRLMTRANLLDLAERFEIYAGVDGMSADDIVADFANAID